MARLVMHTVCGDASKENEALLPNCVRVRVRVSVRVNVMISCPSARERKGMAEIITDCDECEVTSSLTVEQEDEESWSSTAAVCLDDLHFVKIHWQGRRKRRTKYRHQAIYFSSYHLGTVELLTLFFQEQKGEDEVEL